MKQREAMATKATEVEAEKDDETIEEDAAIATVVETEIVLSLPIATEMPLLAITVMDIAVMEDEVDTETTATVITTDQETATLLATDTAAMLLETLIALAMTMMMVTDAKSTVTTDTETPRQEILTVTTIAPPAVVTKPLAIPLLPDVIDSTMVIGRLHTLPLRLQPRAIIATNSMAVPALLRINTAPGTRSATPLEIMTVLATAAATISPRRLSATRHTLKEKKLTSSPFCLRSLGSSLARLSQEDLIY